MSTWGAAVFNVVERHAIRGSLLSYNVIPLYCGSIKVGHIKHNTLKILQTFTDTFKVERSTLSGNPTAVYFEDSLKSTTEKSLAISAMFQKLREREVFQCLKKWRDELCSVSAGFSHPVLFTVERSAAALLGIRLYGVHMNGVVRQKDKVLMWIARRAPHKTYANKLDNLVAGGITNSLGVRSTLIKECQEEASISSDIAANAKPAGSISFVFDGDFEFYAETEFVYDLELPCDFSPQSSDGEVSDFYLWEIEKVKEEMAKENFKPHSALVILDYLIRHGHIDPDKEMYYEKLVTGIHGNLN